MENSTVRVLVVEDYETDKAKELQPDVILLDIGLPKLNGIDAARQIRKFSEAKIVFVSQESDPDIVQEALALGAWGYVLKATAATDLLAAVDAVCNGRRFVSDGLEVASSLP